MRIRLLLVIILIALSLPRISHAQSQLTTLESDDAQVEQSGIWTIQTTAAASGGAYLYSGGNEGDVLTLNFSGPSVEVRYISGPSLGTLAIEIDDSVLRTVITTNETTQYGQSAKIDYLTDEPHTLRVYAQEGSTIAVDAFLISASLSLERGPGGEVNAMPADVLTETAPPQAGPFCAGAPADTIHRILGTGGVQADIDISITDLTPDGRYVAFHSQATNLVPSDTNAAPDVFVFDRVACTVERVSVDSSEAQSNGISLNAKISADGRYVVFNSTANNLVAGDTNGNIDIFRRDRTAGQTIRVTRTFAGLLPTGGNSINPDISADGRFIVYQSDATDIVADDTNASTDIFMRDMSLQITHRISLPSGGAAEGNGSSTLPTISADGSTIIYQSAATNLVAGDTNGFVDVFAYDLKGTTGTTRLSVATNGTQANNSAQNGRVSANGRYVVFDSTATNLVTGDTNANQDVFLRDRQTNTTTLLSFSSAGVQGNNVSQNPTISDDGRFVAFQSGATNLVTSDTNGAQDIFVRDRLKNTTARVSLSATGTQSTGGSAGAVISGNGRYIGFGSAANDLVTGDTNGTLDGFVAPNLAFLSPSGPDTLALFNPAFNATQLVNTLTTNPPITNYNVYNMTPPATGQWVMGDWDSDGDDTPGVYANGPFFYTNDIGQNTVWRSLWIGVAGAPISGRFNANYDNDCIGAVQQSVLGGSTVFVLYFTCDLSGTAVPAISSQWLSAVLPDSGGFTGAHQFASGDYNNDRLDSIAVRRGDFIAFGNVAPSVGDATFDLAQFIGNPGTGTSVFLSGDWNNDGVDSFGLYYSNGVFFRRDDLTFNSGLYTQQATTPLIGTGLTAHAWR